MKNFFFDFPHKYDRIKKYEVMKLAAKERLKLIRQQVEEEKKVTVASLSQIHGVTEETIRRDLEKLEAEGFLTRTFGGAVLNNNSLSDNVYFRDRVAINMEEKRKIAVSFYDILDGKHSISTDSSTTVMEAVKLLKGRDRTVLSFSTEVFSELWNTDIKIISTGGIFNRSTLSLHGRVAKETIKSYRVEIALISCKGLDLEHGAMDTNEDESEVKKCMIKQAEEVALLVDHTKFGKIAFAHVLDLKDVDYLVTDQKPDDAWISYCEENGVRLIY